MDKVCRKLIIRDKLGLHARAATKLAQLTQEFESDITVTQGEQCVNAASVMCLMLLASQQGKTVEVCAEGKDAQAALDAVSALFEDRFEEDE